jgi:hypothetical protein
VDGLKPAAVHREEKSPFRKEGKLNQASGNVERKARARQYEAPRLTRVGSLRDLLGKTEEEMMDPAWTWRKNRPVGIDESRKGSRPE